MCAVSVIVDIALFLSSEARLYHLDEGLLRLCIRLTRNLCSLLVSKADLGSKDPPFQLAYMLFQRYPLPIRTRSWHRYKDVAPTLGKAGRSAHSQDVPNNPYSDLPKDCPFFLERKDSCTDRQ